ncbi:hypothetical protein AVEN_60838-1 [Araneus ventricosus]|uniref:Uncharacterized protein n=1 Tax=Araneus ventricosus TaxID=182803 RepID=A0A4Y2X7V6_ARAVE|nr:hypothetical protein AVEN_57174-1 [Araneus ventricosus]GBO45279.1 hypothetical protein AVEN_60838-1 [Araneus ventricosus]
MTSVGIMAITLNYFFIKFHEANLSGRFPGAAGEGRAISAEKARKACQKRIFNFGIPIITVEPVTNKGKPLQILVGVKDDKVNSCQRDKRHMCRISFLLEPIANPAGGKRTTQSWPSHRLMDSAEKERKACHFVERGYLILEFL